MKKREKPPKPVPLFLSYAHEDESFLRKLKVHLSLLKRQGFISTWHDRQIVPGANWAEAIDEHLEQASIIVLLVSPDFLASDYCYQVEMLRALARHQTGQARLLPVLIRPCDWEEAPFAHLQILPTGAKPIATWENRDQAFLNVVAGIREAIQALFSIQPFHQSMEAELASPSLPNSQVFRGESFVPTPTVPSNKCNLPNRHPHIVGREEQIQDVLTALEARAWFVTIDGMGGVGKTTLALEAAHKSREDSRLHSSLSSFTGYIWTSARNKPNFCLDDVTEAILSVLAPPEFLNSSTSHDRRLLAARALSQEPCLLIVDNLESVNDESLYLFLRDLPGSSKALITSRHLLQTGERVINLTGLGEEDATKLLRLELERFPISVSDQDITLLRIIAKRAQGIPFVLHWMAERAYDGMSLDSIAGSLEKADADDVFDYIFKFSLSMLDSQTRVVFRSMSLLSTWSTIEIISAINPNTSVISDRIGELVKYCLVEDNRKLVAANRRYRLHPFTQYLVKKEFADMPDRKTLIQNALEYYRGYLKTLDLTSHQSDDFEADLLNLDNLLQIASQQGSTSMLFQYAQIIDLIRQLKESQLLPNNVIELINEIAGKSKPEVRFNDESTFLCTERSGLKVVPVFSQVLDNQWLPKNLLQEAIQAGEVNDDLEGRRSEIVRTEYIRALINSEQIVVSLSNLYNNPALYQDYLSGSKNRDAFKQLLEERAIVVVLLTESAPNEPPRYAAAIPGAWRHICGEVAIECLRLSWDDDQNREYTRRLNGRFQEFVLTLVSKDLDKLVRDLGLGAQAKDSLRTRLRDVALEALDLLEKKGMVTREHLYKAFVTVEGTNPAERHYDKGKPFAGEIKQLIDLAYMCNWADEFDGYLLTPVDSLPRTVLQETSTTLQPSLLNIDVKDIVDMLLPSVFTSVYEGLHLRSLNLLSLTDVYQIRETEAWKSYMRNVQALLQNPLSFADGSALAVQESYMQLTHQITKLILGRYHQQDVKNVVVPTTFFTELNIEIGPNRLLIVGAPTTPTIQIAEARTLLSIDSKKYLPLTVDFVTRAHTNKQENGGLSNRIPLLRGRIRNGAQLWEELLKHIRERKPFEQISPDNPFTLTPPM